VDGTLNCNLGAKVVRAGVTKERQPLQSAQRELDSGLPSVVQAKTGAKMTRQFCYYCSSWLFMALAASSVSAQEDSLVAPGEKVKKLAGDRKFTEGPAWIPAKKTLVFSDIPSSKLMQWNEKDGLSVFRESEQSNGNILDLEGRLISCQHAARNLVRTEADGKLTVLVDKFDGNRFNSPNDVAVRSDGTLWFTDPSWGLSGKPSELPGCWVYKFDPATGKVEPVVKDLAMPNGINFSPDEGRIYIADTGGNKLNPDPAFHKKAAGIHCYEVSKDGQLGKKLFQIEHGSDGMCVDRKGNLYTTSGKIMIHNADGKLLESIDVPEGPANCTFGGDDMKTLFITARTSLYSVRMKNAGAKPVGAKW
jgi:gluconolactonase